MAPPSHRLAVPWCRQPSRKAGGSDLLFLQRSYHLQFIVTYDANNETYTLRVKLTGRYIGFGETAEAGKKVVAQDVPQKWVATNHPQPGEPDIFRFVFD